MERKNELSRLLHTLPVNDEVHFQPSENVKLSDPCVLYWFSRYRDFFGNDGRHIVREEYKVTHVYKDPTQNLRGVIRSLFTYVIFDRVYIADNLYHDVYTITM